MRRQKIHRPGDSAYFRRTGGFSLLEIMIALPILALVSLAVVSAVIFSSRLSHIVCNKVAAKNIAQSYFERMAIDDFEDVTPENYPSVSVASTTPIYLDHVVGIKCAVDIEITGYGTAESGSGNSLTDSDASWETNEWTGNTLFLVSGKGSGQLAKITANTADTLTLEGTLDPAPDATTEYMINGGKTVRIKTLWRYMDKPYTETIESLVIDWGPRR